MADVLSEDVTERFNDTAQLVGLALKTTRLRYDRRRLAMRERLVAQGVALHHERLQLLANLNAGYDWLERNSAHDGSEEYEARYAVWLATLRRYEAVDEALRVAADGDALLIGDGGQE